MSIFSGICAILIAGCAWCNWTFDAPSHSTEWKKLWSVPVKAEFIECDPLDQVYALNGAELIKFKADGSVFRVYSNKTLGRITKADCSNPLKISVFYKELGRLIFLDNTLSEQGEAIKMEDLGLELAHTTATSADENGIWIYDPVDFRLLRYNSAFKIKAQVEQINQLLALENPPSSMLEAGNYLIMAVPENGIYILDIFGTFIRKFDIKNCDKLFKAEDGFIYWNKTTQQLFQKSWKGPDALELTLPVKECKDVAVSKNCVFILKNDTLSAFRRGS
ncbi:MAG: hypothetical protein ACK5CY_11005 [Bacteroidia bacterium]|jgi:hypothetical protein